ncbi:MAG: CBS domain-containing protein [Halobacteria archaeon]
MDVKSIVSDDYRVFEPDTNVSKIQGYFEETRSKAAVIADDEYEGIVTQRELISSHRNPKMKGKSVMISPSKISHDEDVREVARLMVESGSKVLPVFRNNELKGVVTAEDLLDEVNSNLGVLDVDDVYTEEVISVSPNTSVGEVINKMRENGISHLVVEDDKGLAGMITLFDLLGFSVRKMDREKGGGGRRHDEHGGYGGRAGEEDRMLDIPARDIMNTPVSTTSEEDGLDKVVETMLNMDYSSLVVVEDDVPVGIVTKTDVLRALTWTEEEQPDVQIANIALLDGYTREDVAELIKEVSDKYKQMDVMKAHVTLQKHKENMRGNPLILAKIILYTSKGQFIGTGEGYGSRHALRLARDRLERRVLSDKEVRRSDRDAERLMKELGL